MLSVRLLVLLCSCMLLAQPAVVVAKSDKSINLGYFDTSVGQDTFVAADIKQPYWRLSRFFITQKTLTYCGVASAVMVLNAMGKLPEMSPVYSPYKLFDQDNVFYNAGMLQAGITPAKVQHGGMTLAQLGRILSAHGANTEIQYGSDMDTAKQLKNQLRQALQDHKYVIVNYDRRVLQQDGAGHISPIAAYHADKDVWLMMDVARYKYAPVWVSSADLLRAIQGIDSDSGLTRGFVVVS